MFKFIFKMYNQFIRALKGPWDITAAPPMPLAEKKCKHAITKSVTDGNQIYWGLSFAS